MIKIAETSPLPQGNSALAWELTDLFQQSQVSQEQGLNGSPNLEAKSTVS